MSLYDGYSWLKANDLPNWLGMLFSLIVWPVVLYWWSTHKRQDIPHFDVNHSRGRTKIGNHEFDAVMLQFKNRTGAVVYLSLARLRGRQESFPVPEVVARNLSGWHELKFIEGETGRQDDDERIIQANDSAWTSIAVSQQMDGGFSSYRPEWFRRWLRRPKYFTLQYTAMVGEKKYSVETTF